VRIATWNVNSIKARLPFVLHWLDARRPDIALLQEVKLSKEKFPFAELEAAGYRAAVHAQATWNGVAVLSREPAEVLQQGLPGAEDRGARFMSVRIGDLTLCSVYVPNGKTLAHPDFAHKLAFLESLQAQLSATVERGGRVVVGGDFNVAPGDADSWDPERLEGGIFHTQEERSRLRALFDLGLVDVYRESNPDGRMFSWWDYRAGCFHKNQGLRIDLLLATAPVALRTTEVWIDRDYRKKKDGAIPSDHAPVIAELGD
jgi:exodeoxyribonuclease-3